MLQKAMKKTKIALMSGLISLPALSQDIQYGIASPELSAQSYILMDYHSGAVLAAFNPDQRQHLASLTKMMTSYVVGDAIKQGKISLTDTVTIDESAWGKNFPGSSKMFLNLNQQVSVADLNRGIVIVSGNDACVAIAEHIAGSERNFIELMNKYVAKFGLKNTNFMTVHGLDDDNQYSSARDMAIIGRHIIHDLPEEYKIYAEKEFTFNKIKQHNRNGLLWDKSIKVDGMKTGHTNKAGYNLVASAVNNNNMRLISVVMGVATHKGREIESKKLLQWGFANFETFKSLQANQSIVEEKVYYGNTNKVQLGVLEDAYITLPKGRQNDVKTRYELNQKMLTAPLAKGQIVGKIIYQLDGRDIASANLKIMSEVQEGGFFSKLWDWLVLTVKGLFN
ncbi:serine hydrolase [Histophilus somni]|uniref:serine hydrolase n=1 Tax=Histophilus somni TaxID=731 RepID=UPI00094A9EEE|nr:serine hydrolase [Histophilus somni]